MCCRVLGASLVRNWDWVEIMRGVGGEGGEIECTYIHCCLQGKGKLGI